MKAAICDDEIELWTEFKRQISENRNIEHTDYFSDINQLSEKIRQGEKYDILFLDIEMGKETVNGIDFAELLYQKCPDVQVIFVTGYHEKYVQKIFLKKINSCGYLMKPVEQDILDKIVIKAMENITEQEKEKLYIQQKGTLWAIPFQSIYYIESFRHQCTIHLENEEVTMYEKLGELKKKLNRCFVQCHKSYIVNMNQIKRIEGYQILLMSGDGIPVSKAKYQELKEGSSGIFHPQLSPKSQILNKL